MKNINTWLSQAAKYSRAEQLDIYKVADFCANYGDVSISHIAKNLYRLSETSLAYGFLLRMEELKAEPAGVAGAIREMLLKDRGEE